MRELVGGWLGDTPTQSLSGGGGKYAALTRLSVLRVRLTSFFGPFFTGSPF